MLFNDSHKNKAPFPMLVTLSGIIMLSNKMHHLKASHPTLVTLFGIVMLFNDIRCIFFPFRIFNKYAFGLVEQYTSTRQIIGITLAYIYALQRITSCKDIISNVYYTVWYCYVFQGCASRKSLIPNAYHTVRNCYALQ